MKKTMKKVITMVLAMCMVLAMSVTVFADTTTTTTGTINMTGTTGHTYSIYQILKGDYDTATGKLSNVVWGSATAKSGTAATEAELSTIAALTSNTQETADAITAYIKDGATATATITGSGSASVDAGYYVIKDTAPADENDSVADSVSTYLVQVVGTVNVTPKSGVPTSQKKVKDINDSTDTTTTGWQDVADYDIGDAVPFELTGTLPANYASYSSYKYTFHDVQSAGLTFNKDSVKVYVDGTEITSGYEVVTTGLTDGCTFEVRFADLKKITSVSATSKITVDYTATLNENAKLGSVEGNPNKSRLEYSSNPNAGGEGDTDKTPWDNVIVFTYKVVVDKYANSVADANKLTGAEFSLTKTLKDGTTTTVAVVKSEDGTEFTFSGLDDGTYTLTETTTPAGYNTIAPINFTVTADHAVVWNGTDEPSTLITAFSGTDATAGQAFTATATTGTISTNVINKSGATLPTTGGIGTTIFYVLGMILVLGAGVVLVTRRRMAR